MKTKFIPLFALMLCVGALFFAGAATAFASSEPAEETLSVDNVWLTGDTLHITVTDGGASRTLELNLSDYAKSGNEYVTVQVTDSAGHKSNAIQFRNPYYDAIDAIDNGQLTVDNEKNQDPKPSTAFTPDGTGAVLDNAVSGGADGAGKEFFTVKTADGNVFYLIIDRQRAADNVYLLNPVTENDLASLAKPGDGKSESAVPTPVVPAATLMPEQLPEPTPVPAVKSGGGGTIAFVVIAAAAVGGAGYYFKIYRPKKQGMAGDKYEDEDAEAENDDYEEDDEQ